MNIAGRPEVVATAAPTTPEPRRARVARKTKRMTLDLPHAEHTSLRQWSVAADVPASFLLRALLDEATRDPGLRARVQAAATDAQDRRYAAP